MRRTGGVVFLQTVQWPASNESFQGNRDFSFLLHQPDIGRYTGYSLTTRYPSNTNYLVYSTPCLESHQFSGGAQLTLGPEWKCICNGG